MGFFSRFSPLAAYRDLRFFLANRQPHELWFLIAALCVTSFLVYAFAKDSYAEPVYRPKIIYVEQWPSDRTDAQIIAQQKIDAPIKAKALAEQKKREEETRAVFKRMDDKMTAMGL
ncbi:hypothetical protein FSB78_16015 [Sphingomonas ginsenosidivorax]|uniref:Uncharacterized protein n=1 Tax=Sphingomonas ginsenosidivorax TaxID=862135 RepID=A0A5C6UHL2_9SPHN|nr:hypothetical protein [Sphingomonas ginsenosidivorax]TXC72282.1 hypothetical protein FSB78_16015 [Sphingomonas ginsenosidivorax]